jgi:hypothetical protein
MHACCKSSSQFCPLRAERDWGALGLAHHRTIHAFRCLFFPTHRLSLPFPLLQHPAQMTAAETLAPTPPDPTTVLRRPTPTRVEPPLLLPPTETEAVGMREEAAAATAVTVLEDTVATEEDMETEVATVTGEDKGAMDRREEEEVTVAIEDMEATEGMILAGVAMVVTLTAAAAVEVAAATTVLLRQEIATGLLLRETPVAIPLPVVAAAMAAIRSDPLAVCVS